MQHARPVAAGQPHRAALGPVRPIVLALIAVLGVGSCSRDRAPNLPDLPLTSVAALRPMWAVVAGSYLRLHREPRTDAQIVGHLRQAEVAEILAIEPGGRRGDGRTLAWYLLEHGALIGWAPADLVDPHGSHGRAQDAASRMRESL